jgi:transposase
LKKKLPELELAIEGYITPEQAVKLKVIKQHHEDLGSRKADLEKIILFIAESYTEEINLILTVPSFKNIFSAIAVVSEIGVNMTCFRQLSIYVPGQD